MIHVRGLVKQFQVSESRVTALKGIDVDVAEGEFFVIVGASGSGKTTLLRCVAGLETPQGGEIRIGGRVVYADKPPTWVPPQDRRLGMVFQSYAVWPHLTVYENVALPLTEGSQRVPRAEVKQRVQQALQMMQIGDLGERSATLLSGGQQQRVALARAVAVNSRVLLMDEPLSNLDARLREEVRDAIRQLAKQLGATVLYVTHDQVEAMAMADKIALMRLGELLQVGAPAELYTRPSRPEVAEFFGSVNWLRGRVVEAGVVETPIGPLRVANPAQASGSVVVGFRPENLVAVAPGQGGQAARSPASPGPAQPNVWEARLTSSTFLGDQWVYHAMVGEQSFVGKARSVPVPSDGRLTLSVDPADIMAFPASADASPVESATMGTDTPLFAPGGGEGDARTVAAPVAV